MRVLDGTSNANIDFSDLCAMLSHYGFTHKNGSGSHHIFSRPGVREIINLQPGRDGKAKPYQVRQVAALIQQHIK
jgi:predicted RNA binding protein YcfA (HicA-like mRNA interferase family)